MDRNPNIDTNAAVGNLGVNHTNGTPRPGHEQPHDDGQEFLSNFGRSITDERGVLGARMRSPALKWTAAPTKQVSVATLALENEIVAASAIELEDFEIETRSSVPESPWQRTIANTAVALAGLSAPREIWHLVVSVRDARVPLRIAMLSIGRAASAEDAIAQAHAGVFVLQGVMASCASYVRPRIVSSSEGLLRLLDVTLAPTVISLRRRRWSVAQIAIEESETASRGSVIPPWPCEPARWSSIASALATAPGSALIVRANLAVRVPTTAITGAERDALEVSRTYERVLAGRVDRTALLRNHDLVAVAASARVAALRGPCVALDVSIVGPGSVAPHLLAIARAAIAGGDMTTEGVAARHPLTLDEVPLEAEELLRPLDVAAHPELLASTREAIALLRTFEPPTDETSPLSCTRARRFPIHAEPSAGTPLGIADSHSGGVPVSLSEAARLRHVYVVGQTGTGKSTLLLNMIVDDIRRGHGVTVLDPHGTLVSEVLERIPRERAEDVVLIDPADVERCTPLNPLSLAVDDPIAYVTLRDRVIDDLIDTVDAIYDLKLTGGPMFEQCFRTFLALLMGGRRQTRFAPSLPLLGVLMADKELQQHLEKTLQFDDPTTVATLEQLRCTTGESALTSMLPYITSKTNRFHAHAAARRMLCQPGCIDFDAVLRERKILLLPLRPTLMGSEAAALVARVIVLRLGAAAMTRGATGAEPLHYLYADEFHTFATERFATLLSEARKFRLGLVLAHQYTSQLERRGSHVLDAVLGNVGTTIAFRVGSRDAELLERTFAPRVHATDIAGQPDYRAIVRSVGPLGDAPFTLRTRRAPNHCVGLGDPIRELARLVHGRDRDVVDAEIREGLKEFRAMSD